jgi:hypothetical protein
LEAKNCFVIADSVRRNIDNSILHGSNELLFYRNLAKDMTEYGLAG